MLFLRLKSRFDQVCHVARRCQRDWLVFAEAMEQYLALVYAGFTGSVTMITCTVLALTRLVFEYRGRPPGRGHAW